MTQGHGWLRPARLAPAHLAPARIAPARRPVLLVFALVVLGGCGHDTPAPTAGATLPAATVALPSVAPRPRSTPSPGTAALGATSAVPNAGAASPEAAATSIGATTTSMPSAACDLDTVVADIGPADKGYRFADLRCVSGWATLVAQGLQPNISTDELVVLQSDAGHWQVVDGGGDTTCQTAAVPPELWGPLSCARWQGG